MSRAYRFLLLLLATASASCHVCPAETYARVLAPDFHSPEGAGQAYLAALACDEAKAEYRCFGESLKDRYGATLDLYLIARPSLLEELGSMQKYADRLQPTRRVERPDGVLVWYSAAGAERVGMLLQAQAFFDLTLRDGTRRGDILDHPPADYLSLDRKSLTLQLESAVLRGVDPSTVERLEVGLEWKIADFLLPEEESPRP
jgi:hypothetical protein